MKKIKNPIFISVWEQDPGLAAQPSGGHLIQLPAPKLSATPLPTSISNPSAVPAPATYAPGTPEFRYWAAAAALRRGSDFWGKLLPNVKWHVGNTLPVDLNKGIDLNAYYDRVGLRFFHDTAGGRTVYSGESPDIINHEQGHAVLDSFKPQLWNAASIEVAAFHESFGDMSAILCALQIPGVRTSVLAQTAGNLYKSSDLSRLAEQLGWAIRQNYPTAVDPDCLRNAVNSFFYRDPNTLPSSAPANSLSSEPHSFSRVFTSAFFDALARIFKLFPAANEGNLLQAATDLGKILICGITAANVVSAFYSQVAANMIDCAKRNFKNTKYADSLKTAFVRHGILSPAAALALKKPISGKARAIAFTAQGKKPELPKMKISVKEYGLGMDDIVVFTTDENRRFDVAGAALAIGAVSVAGQNETAKAFIEDLLRRDKLRLKPSSDSKKEKITSADNSSAHHHTHELVREGGETVLHRIRIDCGLTGHHH